MARRCRIGGPQMAPIPVEANVQPAPVTLAAKAGRTRLGIRLCSCSTGSTLSRSAKHANSCRHQQPTQCKVHCAAWPSLRARTLVSLYPQHPARQPSPPAIQYRCTGVPCTSQSSHAVIPAIQLPVTIIQSHHHLALASSYAYCSTYGCICILS